MLHAKEKVWVHEKRKDLEKDFDWWLCRPYKAVGGAWQKGFIKACHLQKTTPITSAPAPAPPAPAPSAPAPVTPAPVTPVLAPAPPVLAPAPPVPEPTTPTLAPKSTPPQTNIIPTPAPAPPAPAPTTPVPLPPPPANTSDPSHPNVIIPAPALLVAPESTPPPPNIIPTPTPASVPPAPVLPAPAPDPLQPNIITAPDPTPNVAPRTTDKRNREDAPASMSPFKISRNSRREKRTNEWKNPYMRLGTLKTINVTNLWKDVPKHGTTLSRHQQALDIWQSTCASLGVRVVMVSQWKTVSTQAVRWVKRWFSHSETEANKTGHGYASGDEDEVHPCIKDLSFGFRNKEDQDQYLLLLEELSSQLQTNASEAALSAKNKRQEKLKQQNLISAGKLARQRALSRQATVALGGVTNSGIPPGGSKNNEIDLSTSDKHSVTTTSVSTPSKGRGKNKLGDALNPIVLIMERRMTAQATADKKELEQRQIEFQADLEHKRKMLDLEERKLSSDRQAKLLDVMLKNGIDPVTALSLLANQN